MIVLDSGPLVAAVNSRDNHHAACARLLRTHPGPLLVPSTVVTEVCQLVERRQGSKAEAAGHQRQLGDPSEWSCPTGLTISDDETSR